MKKIKKDDSKIVQNTVIAGGIEVNDPVPLKLDITPTGGSLEDQIKRLIRQAQAGEEDYDTFEDEDYDVDEDGFDSPVESIFQEVDSLIEEQKNESDLVSDSNQEKDHSDGLPAEPDKGSPKGDPDTPSEAKEPEGVKNE